MKSRAGPKVTFREGGKVGSSYATPIFFSYYGHILVKFWDNFEGSGFTPSFLPSRPHEMVTFGPTPQFIALSHFLGTNILTLDVDDFGN